MTGTEIEQVIAIIEVLIKHGPKIISVVKDLFDGSDPTPDEIRELLILKDPEDYFTGGENDHQERG